MLPLRFPHYLRRRLHVPEHYVKITRSFNALQNKQPLRYVCNASRLNELPQELM